MTRKTSRLAVVGAEDEPFGFADELDGVKRLAWAIGAAADGIPGQEPGVEGIAYVAGLVVERLEALEERLQQEPPRAA